MTYFPKKVFKTNLEESMNTNEINHVLSTNPVTKKFFNGVYPKDWLEMISEKPELIICNTDASDKSGKHWILIFFNNEDVDFFDSLGNKPSQYGFEFVRFMQKYADVCNLTSHPVQPLNTDLCGHYCIYFAHKHCQGYDMEYILNNLPNKNLIKNFTEVYLKKFEGNSCDNIQCCIEN